MKHKNSLNASNKENKKPEKLKVKPKKSKKFIISKDASSEEEYPVKKYLLPASKEKNSSISKSQGKREN